MNPVTLLGCKFLLAFALLGGQHAGSNLPVPTPFPPPEQPRPSLPIDQPPVVVHGDRRRPPDPKQLKKQADQLAKLSQSISPDIDKVGRGEMPKELIGNLKQIEKLSKKLRRELGH